LGYSRKADVWPPIGVVFLITGFEQRLRSLAAEQSQGLLTRGPRGIEKESLRITPAGQIAQTSHPAALGSALTHRYITTDYSEALLEFVTPPEPHGWAVLQFLCDIHATVYGALDNEMLWPFSMPCRLTTDADIPIARYGTSKIGRMKSIYREGLGQRYGRFMQVISGIHFNYSVPAAFWPVWQAIAGSAVPASEFQSEAYLGLVRNVRRLDWLLLYLFGASPAVCASFLRGRETNLARMGKGTFFGPHATSLRMSDIGYQNSNQSALCVSANSLDEYIAGLSAAVATPNPDYEAIGVKRSGEYLQLNANQLQIENEYYSTIRPKRVAFSGERPTAALSRAGIEYIELRALDISPFDPVGLGQAQQKFLEAFLIYCLLADSPPISESEQEEIRHNHLTVATRGRDPDLKLARAAGQIGLRDWADEVCAGIAPICELLEAEGEQGFNEALGMQLAAVADAANTPSARLLAELDQTGLDFADYGLRTAQQYQGYFADLSTDLNQHAALFEQEALDSVARQQEIEASDSMSLAEYIAGY
jgi:glutamate--cysteine ligase